MSSLARLAFALLACATVGAFFVTQRLKAEPPVLNRVSATKFFSPNGDGARERSDISFQLKEADDVTVSVIDRDGDRVRELVSGRTVRKFSPVRLTWDGRDDDGHLAPDGEYRLRIALAGAGRAIVPPGLIVLDTKPPQPVIVRRDPAAFLPGRGPVTMAVRGAGRRAKPVVEVWRTDVRPAVKVAEVAGRRGRKRVVWDGLVGGAPAPAGIYMLVPRVADRAGNEGTTPAQLPPDPGDPVRVATCPRCEAGVTVRRLAAQVPVLPVRAGRRFEIRVDSQGRPFSYRLRRVGQSRVRVRGRGRSGHATVLHAPGGESGLYVLQLRAGGDTLDLPIAVQSNRRSAVLVVLPAATWLGTDRVDDDRDGLPDTLADGRPVRTSRVLTRQPPDIKSDIADALVFLDRARITYDLTTDLALAGTRDPRPTDRDGVLLIGDHRWVPTDVGRRLRRYVLDGGRLVAIGTEGLRRSVDVERGNLVRPTAPARTDLFGARVRAAEAPPKATPLVISQSSDSLGLFVGTSGELAGIDLLERVADPGRRAHVLEAATLELPEPDQANVPPGTEPPAPEPAVYAARLGKGLLVRIGVGRFAERLCGPDAAHAQVFRNAFDLLRGVKPKLRDAQDPCGAEPAPKPAKKKKRKRRRRR